MLEICVGYRPVWRHSFRIDEKIFEAATKHVLPARLWVRQHNPLDEEFPNVITWKNGLGKYYTEEARIEPQDILGPRGL